MVPGPLQQFNHHMIIKRMGEIVFSPAVSELAILRLGQ
jgi:hypothetical protein